MGRGGEGEGRGRGKDVEIGARGGRGGEELHTVEGRECTITSVHDSITEPAEWLQPIDPSTHRPINPSTRQHTYPLSHQVTASSCIKSPALPLATSAPSPLTRVSGRDEGPKQKRGNNSHPKVVEDTSPVFAVESLVHWDLGVAPHQETITEHRTHII